MRNNNNKFTSTENHDNQNGYEETIGSVHNSFFKISTYLTHRTIIWL